MSLYYLFWAILILASLWASLGGFLWAQRHGQFSDQERARYLPLRGEPRPLLPESLKGKGRGKEAYAMLAVLLIGLSGLLVLLILVILRAEGAMQAPVIGGRL
jgi:hypothetical protein